MDKNAIKKFATKARHELISRVSQRAFRYGISDKEEGDADAETVNEHLLSSKEKEQRAALIAQIKAKGYKQVMEEVAYTWFNRFSALRFMEVNGYLPSKVRVFTDEENEFNPQILTEAMHMELSGLDREKVYAYKEANNNDELYKYLLITQCNALNSILPGMFQKISDYTELLFPDNLLRKGSVIHQMIEQIPEDDWKDQVQIIGWLYQYYNSEKKDEVFAALKTNVKISKENIPAATQLFTPDWIVRYMVENSLGRLWLEGHPNDGLKSQWKYYIEEAEQETEVKEKLAEIRKEYATLTPDSLKVIDPCSGSGHILAYMFDVLMKIYESYGYATRDAVIGIMENNLYGLDIDERAAQLAYFSVMMKGRQYDTGFFQRKVQPQVYAIAESQDIEKFVLEYFCNGDAKLKKAMDTIISEMHDAKEYGSIITVSKQDWSALYARFDAIEQEGDLFYAGAVSKLRLLVEIAEILAQKYDVVVTNPPYMGRSNMNPRLLSFVKKNYPDSKSDLFAIFIERCGKMNKKNGYRAMITQHAWMFLTSFVKLRKKLLCDDIVNMIHLGTRAFEEIGGEVVQTTAFVMRKSHNKDYKGTYCRLVDPTTERGKEDMFLNEKNRYVADQFNFSKIPGSPVAYWASEKMLSIFGKEILSNFGTSCIGMRTGDNNRFLRYWFEVNREKTGINFNNLPKAYKNKEKWIPYCKGGSYRKWYGNNEYVVNWEDDGYEIKENTRLAYPQLGDNLGWKISNEQFYFIKGLTWSGIGVRGFGVRCYPAGMIFDSGANSYFVNDEKDYLYFAGLLNCNIIDEVIKLMNPTINTGCGLVANLPVKKDVFSYQKVNQSVSNCIRASRADWDSFEISWDFVTHPLITYRSGTGLVDIATDKWQYRISDAYYAWKVNVAERFNLLKRNEEELNRIFIGIYGLQDELTPEVADKDITVHRIFDTKDDVPESMQGSQYVRTKRDEVISFISYAVGCMFGRYSLDVEGLVYAGGNYDSKYCRWIRQFGDKATEEIDENGNLIHGGWAGCTLWEYDGVKKDGKWIPASFAPDADNIIPICDDEYFEDDIVGRFVKFVEAVYGKETLQENLKFIADALGGKGQPKEVIRNYFLNGFYADHCKMYQKRPIYWLFDSGKKNGFKCLIYMHRYEPDLLARIRTDYVHEQQSRYHAAIADLESRIDHATTAERVKLNKKLKVLTEQETEIHEYEEKIHHLADRMISIDLDDGVKNNYAIFKDVLAKIR